MEKSINVCGCLRTERKELRAVHTFIIQQLEVECEDKVSTFHRYECYSSLHTKNPA